MDSCKDKDNKGIFEDANNGTIFLDEIGDVSPLMQQSLLRVLQSDEIQPLGSNKIKKVNVRIICATNQNLIKKCQEGRFRWDLYYRISNAELELPSLKERGQKEKAILVKYFIKKLKKDINKKSLLKLSREVDEAIMHYSFPGNVRELINTLATLYVFSEEVKIDNLDRLPRRLREMEDPFWDQ